MTTGIEIGMMDALVRREPPRRERPSSPEDGVLLGVAELLGQEVDLDRLMNVLVERVAESIGADRATLYLVDHARGELYSRAAHLPELPEIRLRLGQGLAGHVAATGEIVNVPRTTSDARFFGEIDRRTGYTTRSMLACPLRDRAGAVVGVLQVLNKRRGDVFDAEDEVLLTTLARQVVAALAATSLAGILRRAPEGTVSPPPLAYRFNRIVGESEAMRAVYSLTERAARTDATVLVRGESGTGKELIARAVHVNSTRVARPYVKVDCAALPAGLIENELFGHEKGAFTGADERAPGKFEVASGGTVFIDEIGELPLPVQGKLLGVLQDRELTRVGGTRPVKVDVRVVAATNRDLERMIAEGTFRADLYYRIRVVEIGLPSLRERGRDDVERLARQFLEVFARKHGKAVSGLTDDALERLGAYAWPGNVRELENCIESAVVLSDDGALSARHLMLPGGLATTASSLGLRPYRGRTLAEAEKDAIAEALRAHSGNRTAAAKTRGIGRNTLNRKIREYGLAGR